MDSPEVQRWVGQKPTNAGHAVSLQANGDLLERRTQSAPWIRVHDDCGLVAARAYAVSVGLAKPERPIGRVSRFADEDAIPSGFVAVCGLVVRKKPEKTPRELHLEKFVLIDRYATLAMQGLGLWDESRHPVPERKLTLPQDSRCPACARRVKRRGPMAWILGGLNRQVRCEKCKAAPMLPAQSRAAGPSVERQQETRRVSTVQPEEDECWDDVLQSRRGMERRAC